MTPSEASRRAALKAGSSRKYDWSPLDTSSTVREARCSGRFAGEDQRGRSMDAGAAEVDERDQRRPKLRWLRVLAEDGLDRLPERLAAVDDEPDRLLGIQAAIDQIGERRAGQGGGLGRAFP